jgi:hypothetical protein
MQLPTEKLDLILRRSSEIEARLNSGPPTAKSFGNQFRFAVIGRYIALAVMVALFTSAQVLAQGNGSDISDNSKREEQTADKNGSVLQSEFAAEAPTLMTQEKTDDARPYKPNCGEPKNAEDANFCQQKRAADAADLAARAAEEAVVISRDQLALTYYGLFGVIITVLLTFWTALSARRSAISSADSARAANDTVAASQATAIAAQQSIDVARDDQRAWIGFERWALYLNADEAIGINGIIFEFNFRNFGRTPGLKCSIVVAPAEDQVFDNNFETRTFENSTAVSPNVLGRELINLA